MKQYYYDGCQEFEVPFFKANGFSEFSMILVIKVSAYFFLAE